MKQIKYEQKIDNGLKSVVLMPTYGTHSYVYRGKLALPMVIERQMAGGHYESEKSLMRRVDQAQRGVEKKIVGGTNGLWLNRNYLKPSTVKHDYGGKAKVNKKKLRK